jgi:hypothetical protein
MLLLHKNALLGHEDDIYCDGFHDDMNGPGQKSQESHIPKSFKAMTTAKEEKWMTWCLDICPFLFVKYNTETAI